MTCLTVSPTTANLRPIATASTITPVATIKLSESQPEKCCDDVDRLHPLWEILDDQWRMADAFTQFAEALVPCLAGLAVEQPSVLSKYFDLRNDDGQLRVVDSDMTPKEVTWLESRLNAHPSLSKLAVEFNNSVVGAYGDVEHPYYLADRATLRTEAAIPGLAGTVDRDVKFMSLLRTVRDADCGEGALGDYYLDHRYELAATKVKDFIMTPETYLRTAAGGLALATAQKSSSGQCIA